MKKLFTLFLAMFVLCATFAQSNKYAVTNTPVESEMSRSNWYGWYFQSNYVHVQAAESEYQLFIPAGTFSSDVTLEQVRFYCNTSENITSYTGDPFTLDVDFIIRIYNGSSLNGTDFNPGEIAYTQTYNPEAAGAEVGVQLVQLNTPFVVHPTDNVTIGIYCADRCSMGLGDHDPECAGLNFAYWPEYGEGFHHYYWTAGDPAWAYENAPVREHDPWNLSVYYNDGQGYQYISDWASEIYDPDDPEQYPDEITRLIVDNYTDSIYFYGGTFNHGIDTSIGQTAISVYLIDENLGELYFYQDEQWGQYDIDTIEPNVGWRLGPIGLIGLETQFEEEGLTWPIQMCISSSTAFSRNTVDPNLDNNTYCIEVGRESDFEDGLHENTKDLTVYPNPASNLIHIANEAGAQISVYNIAGQEVMAIESAEANESINVAALSEGLYIVRVANGNEVFTAKVNIVR